MGDSTAAVLESRTDRGSATRTDSGDAGRRGRALYDRWSDREGLYDRVMELAAPLRDDTFDALEPGPGERVLDLGCGNGMNFPRLRDGVGAEGAVVGLDYSRGMTAGAAERVRNAGWTNVHVVRGDATRMAVAEASFDAALTTFALHTMEDADAVVENVYDALEPGGRFVALDSRGLQSWPARLANPLFERALTLFVNHQRTEDPLGAIRTTFDAVDVVETYDAGSGYLVEARKAPLPAGDR